MPYAVVRTVVDRTLRLDEVKGAGDVVFGKTGPFMCRSMPRSSEL